MASSKAIPDIDVFRLLDMHFLGIDVSPDGWLAVRYEDEHELGLKMVIDNSVVLDSVLICSVEWGDSGVITVTYRVV